LRIALFCNDYWPTIGGVQTGMRGMAIELARRGHQPIILTRQPGGSPAREMLDGVEVSRFEWNLRPRATFPLRLIRARQAVRAKVLRSRPAAVFAHFVSAHALYAWDCARTADVPLILSFRGNDVSRIAPGSVASRWVYARLTQAAAVNLFCSGWLKREAEAAPWFRGRAERTGVLADAVAIDDRKPPQAVPAKPFALAPGRLVYKKGFDLLLRAWTHLGGTIPDLWIAGDGEERDALHLLAGALGLGGRVKFLGAVPHPELLGLLERAALCIVPSREEPYGIVPVEAQALGVPVVTTAVGNLPELVQDGVTGWLAAPTAQSLADTIRRAWHDPRRQIIAAAGRTAPGATRGYDTMVTELLRWIETARHSREGKQ
jgi:D-inositol-3-phosphate glycosyltransferase